MPIEVQGQPSGLYQSLQSTYEALAGLPGRYGDPRYQTVAYKVGPGAIVVLPEPTKVLQTDPSQVGKYLTETVMLLGDEYSLKLPRSTPEATLRAAVFYLRYDTVLSQGIKSDLLYLDASDAFYYTAVVRPRLTGK